MCDKIDTIPKYQQERNVAVYKPNKHYGSDFENFLRQEGIFDVVEEAARSKIKDFYKSIPIKTISKEEYHNKIQSYMFFPIWRYNSEVDIYNGEVGHDSEYRYILEKGPKVES